MLPGETAVLLGGVLAHEHQVSLPLIAAVAVLAAITGDSVGYEVGKRIKNGQFVVNRDRVEALERAAKAKRLADQRAREIAIRRARSET